MIKQEQLDGLAHFLAVAELRSFSAAAARQGVSPSAISQAVRALERRLGVALFNRTTRSVSLTEAGARYLELAMPALRSLMAAANEIGAAGARPQGTLRLNVLRAGYMVALQPILGRFLAAYPEIDVEVAIDARLRDIVAEGFDAGIRFGDVVERDMVTVKVGPPLRAHILASPGYLAGRPLPRHPSDLLAHDCIGFRQVTSGLVERWAFAKGRETLELAVTGRLVFNDSAALVQSALDGLGIVYMVNGYIEPFLRDGRLVRLLADWSPPLAGFTLYYPDRRRVPPKLRALIDFLRADREGSEPATAAVIV